MRGWTTITYGLVPMTLMGAKSLTGSYAVFVVTGRIAICDGLPISSICPSADERATASAATAPTAAGRFSTTNCCPNASPRGCAIRRAMPSLLPPGAKGTRILTGFCGQVCERAEGLKPAMASTVSAANSTFRACTILSNGFSNIRSDSSDRCGRACEDRPASRRSRGRYRVFRTAAPSSCRSRVDLDQLAAGCFHGQLDFSGLQEMLHQDERLARALAHREHAVIVHDHGAIVAEM